MNNKLHIQEGLLQLTNFNFTSEVRLHHNKRELRRKLQKRPMSFKMVYRLKNRTQKIQQHFLKKI